MSMICQNFHIFLFFRGKPILCNKIRVVREQFYGISYSMCQCQWNKQIFSLIIFPFLSPIFFSLYEVYNTHTLHQQHSKYVWYVEKLSLLNIYIFFFMFQFITHKVCVYEWKREILMALLTRHSISFSSFFL